jgi:hypothetical protein
MSDTLRTLDLVARQIQANPSQTLLHSLALNLVNATRRALAQIETPSEAAELRNKVRAIEVYAQRQRATLADSNLISAERLRIERVIGQMLRETASAGNPQFSHAGRNGKLPDGITWNDSSRWQKLADLDDADFEMWLAEQLQSEQEISTAAALAFWSRFVQDTPGDDDTPESPDDEETTHEIHCPHCDGVIRLSSAAKVIGNL